MAEPSSGASLSHYRIVSKLGAGGMGEVYLAQDTKLDRKIALKILPADLAANRDRMRRFTQEAKSAAALNHPNIATIHEIGESDGVNFIAMEFVDGATLREKIHQEQADLRKLLRYLTKKTYELEPNFVTGRYVLGLAYNANGMYAEAIALSEKSLQTDPTSQFMLRVAGDAYARTDASGKQKTSSVSSGKLPRRSM
jgi:tetratricopeptide (TPR) repeat protein